MNSTPTARVGTARPTTLLALGSPTLMTDRLHQAALQLDVLAEALAIARAQPVGPLHQKRFDAIARAVAAAKLELEAAAQMCRRSP